MTGQLIHEDDVPLLHSTMRAFRGGSRNPPPTKRGKQPPPYRPPIVAILLEDLLSGETADAAVLALEETNEVQLVTLEGEIVGGHFQLWFRSKERDPDEITEEIPFDATPKIVQAALEKLPSINQGDVEVSLGQNIGRWFVRFAGQYADQDVPLMRATNGLASGIGGAVVINSTTFLDGTGRTEQVRGLIPVGNPTPLVAGAMVIAIWFPRIGYGVISAECRDFDADEPYSDGYSLL
jgi:hypothetical protein